MQESEFFNKLLEDASINLTLERVCAELVFVTVSVACSQIDLDLSGGSVDRSDISGIRAMGTPLSGKLVRRERSFYFVGLHRREVIYSVVAATIEEAWQEFRSSAQAGAEILFVIKTETEIYLAQ